MTTHSQRVANHGKENHIVLNAMQKHRLMSGCQIFAMVVGSLVICYSSIEYVERYITMVLGNININTITSLTGGQSGIRSCDFTTHDCNARK